MEESGSAGEGGVKNDSKVLPKKIWTFFTTFLSLNLFVLDIGLDIWAAVKLFEEGSYWSLSVLLVLLIGSAVLTHIYSWLWYTYDEFEILTYLEETLRSYLRGFHFFLFGIHVRHAAIVTASVQNFYHKSSGLESVIRYRKQDLRILRIFESYSESAPQVVLMLTLALRQERWIPKLLTALKTLVSLASIALSELRYYHSLTSYIPKDTEDTCCFCFVKGFQYFFYFMWKLLLVSCRLVALALFASVEPCFIFTHFLCFWLVLFYFASYSETHFMKSPRGKWLFRSTLGLIWYFSWFSGVVKGKTTKRMLFYHFFMLLDVCALCGMWYWRMSLDPPSIEISCVKVAVTAAVIPACYVCGLLLKAYYFLALHPKCDLNSESDEVEGNTTGTQTGNKGKSNFKEKRKYLRYLLTGDEKYADCLKLDDGESSQKQVENLRMKKLAQSFYT